LLDELFDFLSDLSDLVRFPGALGAFLPQVSLVLTTIGLMTVGAGVGAGVLGAGVGAGVGAGGDAGSGLDCGGDRSDFLLSRVFLIATGIQNSMHPQRKKNAKAVALKYVPCSVVHSAVSSSKLAEATVVTEIIKMRTVFWRVQRHRILQHTPITQLTIYWDRPPY
jgi:hypothetical protein